MNQKNIKGLQALILHLIIMGTCSAQNEFNTTNKKVDKFINNQMKTFKIPGMAIAIVKNGRIIKLSGYGLANLEWDTNVNLHTNFQIASCTKLLTSSLLLKTIYEGKISLSDNVESYIDSIPPGWKNLKIKHLANHSSGLKEFR